jgi:hypothetical protein
MTGNRMLSGRWGWSVTHRPVEPRPALGLPWQLSRSPVRRSHLDVLSPFRPCGSELVEFFNSTGWALHGQVAVPMRLPDAGRLPRNIFHPVQIGCELA